MSAFTSIDSVEAISARWLTELLALRYPGVVVESAYVGTVITGTATKVRLLLDYNRAGHDYELPTTMWLKAGLEAHSVSDHLKAVYLGEALFYRDLAEPLNLGPPKAYAACVDDATGQSYILMEDLLARHVSFGHSTQPISPDRAAGALEVLAKLHARYWGSHALDGMAWLQGGGSLGKSGVHNLTYGPEIWNRCLGLPRGRFMRGFMADREAMHGVMSRLLAWDLEHAHCLVHGDAQLMNMYFTPKGEAGLLDWQAPMWGYWAHDVTEFTVTALTIEDRRAHERRLIEHYVEALKGHGVTALSADTAWAEYVRHTAYTFHWVLCQPEWQPETVVLANSERACAAMEDHDSLKLW